MTLIYQSGLHPLKDSETGPLNQSLYSIELSHCFFLTDGGMWLSFMLPESDLYAKRGAPVGMLHGCCSRDACVHQVYRNDAMIHVHI